MRSVSLSPFTDIAASPLVTAIPKTELHVHAEVLPRLDRVLARREGRAAYDWATGTRRVMAEQPPGIARLHHMEGAFPRSRFEPLRSDPELLVARVADLLEEAAAEGAVLVEVRYGGNDTDLHSDFLTQVREAARRIRLRYPTLSVGTLVMLTAPNDQERTERALEVCIAAAGNGVDGVDFISDPYDAEADWRSIECWAARAAGAGLGVTVHAGEFSTANLAAALRVPGITRVGHATQAARDPRLIHQILRSGVTVECCLTSNVVLGAVTSYDEHPLRRFVTAGIPIALCTDNPVRFCTTIGREYALAAALGFSPPELLGFTRNAVRASFLPPHQRTDLLAALNAWDEANLPRGPG